MFGEGQQIGSYILIRKLGKGGFGEVWLAEKRSQFVVKKVAVKLPLDEQVNVETIRQEATLWEQASGHPNVLPIIDADIYNGQVVIVSEYAESGSLDDKLKKQGKLTLNEAIEMTIGILSGLDFLHSKKIIHRDIKPANILLQGNTPRLADFGISRAMHTEAVSSTIIGTDAYMSPESFEGKRSVQTDIWAVGVVLYQLVKGDMPFPQEHPTERMFAVLMREPEPLPDGIPQNLRKIINKALAKNPDERFQTASGMLNELKSLLYNNPPTTAPESPVAVTEPFVAIQPPTQQSFSPPQTEKRESATEILPQIPLTVSPFQASETAVLVDNKILTEKIKEKKAFPKTLFIAAIAVFFILLSGGIFAAGYFIYQKSASVSKVESGAVSKIEENSQSFTKLSAREMEFLLKDANPEMLKKMADPEVRKQQVENVRQMMALASAAKKEGLDKDEKVKSELEDIRVQLLAVNYDREINKDSKTPFSSIAKERVDKFWQNGNREAEFQKFFDTKIEIAVEDGKLDKKTKPTDKELAEAREYFAKSRIYADEAKEKWNDLSADFKQKVELAVKLQQAQYLSRLYAKKVLAEKTKVTDEEVQKYIAEHPESKKQGSEKIREQLETEKEKKALDEVAANNPVTVAEDFTIPKTSEK